MDETISSLRVTNDIPRFVLSYGISRLSSSTVGKQWKRKHYLCFSRERKTGECYHNVCGGRGDVACFLIFAFGTTGPLLVPPLALAICNPIPTYGSLRQGRL